MRDAGAYDDFYRSTSQRLLRYCYALTGELGEAQDVAQETYVRAWRHWRTVSVHAAPEAWLRLTASRLATDRHDIRERISGILLSTEYLIGVLTAAGADLSPKAIHLSRDFYETALLRCREIRNRYTFLDLAANAGHLQGMLGKL